MNPSKTNKPTQRNITPSFLKFKRISHSIQASPKTPKINKASKPNMDKAMAPKQADAASKSAKKESSTSAK